MESHYMHKWTGSVATKSEWITEMTEEEMEHEKCATKDALWDKYISAGYFIEI